VNVVPVRNGYSDLGIWNPIFYEAFGGRRGRRVLGKILGERCLRCEVLDAPTNLSVGFPAVLDTVNGDGPGSVVNVVEHPVDPHP
jgi:hypothetical protein